MEKHLMNEDARRIRNEYYRKWRANNKDKVKATNNRYWENKAASSKTTDEKEDG